MADAFDVDFFWVHPKAVRERRKNADLVRGVVAVNVEVGRRFGVTEFLRVGENFGEVRAFEFHARQNVIASAVDDAVKRVDAVADKTFAQRFDDRNAAANAGFVIKIRAEFFRRRKKFLAMRGKQRFVRGDDWLAEFERGQNNFTRDSRAADKFGDDLDFWIVRRLRASFPSANF